MVVKQPLIICLDEIQEPPSGKNGWTKESIKNEIKNQIYPVRTNQMTGGILNFNNSQGQIQ